MLLYFQELEESIYINFPDILVNYTCVHTHTYTRTKEKEKKKRKKILFATTARTGWQESAHIRLLPTWLRWKTKTSRRSKHPLSLPGLLFLNLSCIVIFFFFQKTGSNLNGAVFKIPGGLQPRTKHKAKESSKPKQKITRSFDLFSYSVMICPRPFERGF